MRVLTGSVLLLVGAVSAMAGVLVHARWWGLLLVLAALTATMAALPAGWWARMSFSLGWVAALGYALVPRPEGDFLLASATGSSVLLAAGLAVIVWAIATLPRPTTASSRLEASESDDRGEVGTSS